MKKRRTYRVCSVFDTETTTLGAGLDAISFPCLYIVNDLRSIDIATYTVDRDDDIRFFRKSSDMFAYIEDLISWGMERDTVPIVCAYNLSFDLQSLLYELNKRYNLSVLAQSSTSYYTLDVLSDNGTTILRFWDTFYLEMGGLSAMGRTCGVAKAEGYWDYKLVRGQETPLTDDELHYASRDVQVIPAYLAWVLRANEHVRVSDLGTRLLTKTSLVRLLGSRVIGKLKAPNGTNTFTHFKMLCSDEIENSFTQYALRKACFRGGLTFTAANTAGDLFNNVASFDVVSMHHTFINGRTIPVKFKLVPVPMLRQALQVVQDTTLDDMLANYHEPFIVAFNMSIRVTNVRPKQGSVFDRAGIFSLSYSKFKALSEEFRDFEASDIRNVILENHARARVGDSYENGIFAFGKLIKAKSVIINCTELEYWIFTQIYDFDNVEPVFGEVTMSFRKPPAYVSLQSNLLFEQKSAVKKVLGKYSEGVPYTDSEDLELLPDGLRKELAEGTCDMAFLESYYTSTVKGMFNSVYGTMAQDVYKPDFLVREGNIFVDDTTMPCDDNFEERQPEIAKVLYTYGSRIVGGSRQHLVAAMLLIDRALGERAQILGGDTDSLKVQLNGCTVDGVLAALKPLHDACDKGMAVAQEYIRDNFPKQASTFDDVGHFEYEGTTYSAHVELWNKARISYDGRCHVTLAGIPRPPGAITVETFCDRFVAKHGVEKLPNALGYNLELHPSISHFLGTVRPSVDERAVETFKDYLGNICTVDEYRAVSLYETSKEIGSILMRVNADNVRYLKALGKKPYTEDRELEVIDDVIYVHSMEGTEEYHA